MNKRLRLQSPARTGDGQGGCVESWADVAEVWAELVPLKGYERMQAMQLESPITHRVTMRWRRGVTNAQRLLYGDRVFNIKEALNLDEQDAFLQLLCVETAA
jgi:SPP1 family predicted phage head-tail adaptor